MQIQYEQHLSMMIECTFFITNYLQHMDYLNSYQHIHEKDHDQRLSKQTYVYLNSIMQEIGTIFETSFSDCTFMFTGDGSQALQPILNFIFTYYDPSIVSYQEQIQHFKKVHEQDPLCMLRTFIEQEDMVDLPSESQQEVMKYFNQLEISDSDKWKLFSLHLQFDDTMQRLEMILDAVAPMYQKHIGKMEQLLENYREECTISYEDGDMYEHFTKNNGVNFITQEKQLVILPSIACCHALRISDSFLRDDHIVLCAWGGFLSIFQEIRKQAISIEEVCNTLKTMSDPSKFEILHLIAHKRAYGAEIAKALKLSTPTISYHMQALLQQQLIVLEKHNNKLYYHLNEERLDEVLHAVKQHIMAK